MADVYYFTYTGCSKKIANWISEVTGSEAKEIVAPKFPYAVWLILSFFPLLEVKARFSPPEDDTIFLCFPKWTLNCPPVTYFLRRISAREIYMVISYGGFDEKRYANFYAKLAASRAKIVDVKLVKRRNLMEMESETKKEVLEWVRQFI